MTVFRKAFTLMEVNLAILVMAGGILSAVTMFSLAFRESRQSSEDTAAAALADAVLGKLVTALSDPNVTWEQFKRITTTQDGERVGWGVYFDSDGDVISDPTSKARQAFSAVMADISSPSSVNSTFPTVPSSLQAVGLVVQHDVSSRTGAAVVRLAFRAAAKPRTLLSSPIYFTSVTFGGAIQESERDKEE